jgi:hypothetical protein
MDDDIKALKRFSKKLIHRRVDESSSVWKKPCLLYSAAITGSTTGVTTAVLRDGHGTSGKAIIDLAAVTSAMEKVRFAPPLYFDNGLYVDLGANVTSVFVHFLPA